MAAENDDASIFRFASVLVVAFHCAAVSFGTARRGPDDATAQVVRCGKLFFHIFFFLIHI